MDSLKAFSLEGKNAWITGASYGIGFNIAKAFHAAGIKNIIFNDVKQELVDRGLASYKEAGIEAHGYVCDVTNEDQVQALVKKIHEEVGQIDILVNNAGIIKRIPMHEMARKDFQQVIDIDLVGPFIVSKAVLPEMMERKEGKIINISSQSGVVALDDHGAYGASKGGLNMLTKVMTVEWAKHNIQANSVCPTVILTPMGEMVWGDPAKGDPMKAKIPAARFGRTTEVADLILFLASSASDMINGQTILLDGGFTAQ